MIWPGKALCLCISMESKATRQQDCSSFSNAQNTTIGPGTDKAFQYLLVSCQVLPPQHQQKRRCPLVIESEDRRIKCYVVLSWNKHNQEPLGTKHPKTSKYSELEIDFLGQQQRVFIVLGPFQFTNESVAKCLLFWEGSFCKEEGCLYSNIPLESLVFFRTINDLFNICRKVVLVYRGTKHTVHCFAGLRVAKAG